MFNSNNFATTAAVAEECDLLSAVLVLNLFFIAKAVSLAYVHIHVYAYVQLYRNSDQFRRDLKTHLFV